MSSKLVDYKESPYASTEQCGVGHSYDLEDKFRSLMEEIRSCKADIDKIMQA